MKSNKLKNLFLAIIALNLTLITLFQLNIWPSTANATDFNANYGLVPLNKDGSVNVNLASSNTIDVNISEIGGGFVSYGKLKVEIVD